MIRSQDRSAVGVSASRSGVTRPKKFSTDPWVRPADWITLPTVSVGEEKIVFVYQIRDASTNFLAFSIEGAYTVDWGDTVVENFATGVVAMHNYTYSSISAGTTLSDGSRQVLVTITPQAGNNITSINFQRKYTGEHATSMKSRLIMDITISAPNCTSLRFGADQLTFGNDTTCVAGFPVLERFTWVGGIAAPPVGTGFFSYCFSLKSVTPPPTTGMTSASGMFYYNTALVEAPQMDLSSCTSTIEMFYRCESLRVVPNYDTSLVTDFDSMFYYCNSLERVPTFNTQSGAYFGWMFYGCSSLKEVPPLNTSNGTNFDNMYYYCFNVREFPYINTSQGTSFASMYEQCRSAKTFPVINTALGTNMSLMYGSCYALEYAPAIDTSSATNMSSMFATCYSLKSVPSYNTANVTNMSSMFATCYSLKSVPNFNTSNVTDMSSMFSNCRSLREIPAFDMTKVTTTSSMMPPSTSFPTYTKVPVTGLGVSLSIASANLSAAELDAFYTNLITLPTAKTITAATWSGTTNYTYTYTTSVAHGFRVGQTVTITGATPTVWNRTNATITAVTSTTFSLATTTTLPTAWTSGGTTAISATVTVTGCFGTTADTPTIATAKGWTVTG